VLLGITYVVVAGATGAREVMIERALPGQFGPPTGLLLSTARPNPKLVGAPVRQPGGGADVTAVQWNAIAGTLDARYQSATSATVKAISAKAKVQLEQQRADQLSTLLIVSGAALGLMAFVSIGLGWWMAGRALRPVRTMNARVRGMSERNLHERLALEGPRDELKELGDTFDGLLGRLEAAFESQRRFVANASHELRTPITLERTLVDVALADPNPSLASLRDTCERVRVASEQQERLIESLLMLARSERGLATRDELDLGEVVGEVIQGAGTTGLVVERELEDTPIRGDGPLVERLVANLVDNAVKYNEPGGWIRVRTGIRDGRPALSVSNSGPVVPGDQLERLIEPFTRLGGDRTNGRSGLGLGLSIVGAIATAHHAELTATPNPGGGLMVEVRFLPA
jgi:signal transduction histidine kinase